MATLARIKKETQVVLDTHLMCDGKSDAALANPDLEEDYCAYKQGALDTMTAAEQGDTALANSLWRAYVEDEYKECRR